MILRRKHLRNDAINCIDWVVCLGLFDFGTFDITLMINFTDINQELVSKKGGISITELEYEIHR